jgi:hypothetical protein
VEDHEDFFVQLDAGSVSGGYGFVSIDITGDARMGVIRNDSVHRISITNVATSPVTEGGSGFTNVVFTLKLTNVHPVDGVFKKAQINYSTSGTGANPATAGTDFGVTTGTVTFSAGSTVDTVDISVPVYGDMEPENDETFSFELTAPLVEIYEITGTNPRIVTIVDDDYGLTIKPQTAPSNIDPNTD